MNRKVNWIQRIILSVFFIFSLVAIGNTFSYMGREDVKKKLQVDDYLDTDFDYFEIKDPDNRRYDLRKKYPDFWNDIDPLIYDKRITISLYDFASSRFYGDNNYWYDNPSRNMNFAYPYQFIRIPESCPITYLDVNKPDGCYDELKSNKNAYPVSIGDALLEQISNHGFTANGIRYKSKEITKDNIIGFKFEGIYTHPGKNMKFDLIITDVHHIDGNVFHLKSSTAEVNVTDVLSYSFYFDPDDYKWPQIPGLGTNTDYSANNNLGYLCKKYTNREKVMALREVYDETQIRWENVSDVDKTNVRFWPWLYSGDLDWISFLWFLIFFILAMIPYIFINIIDLINLHSVEDFLWFTKKNGYMLLIDYLLFLVCFLFIHFFALSLYPLWVPLLLVLAIPSLLMLLLELIASFRLISQWPKKEKKTE